MIFLKSFHINLIFLSGSISFPLVFCCFSLPCTDVSYYICRLELVVFSWIWCFGYLIVLNTAHTLVSLFSSSRTLFRCVSQMFFFYVLYLLTTFIFFISLHLCVALQIKYSDLFLISNLFFILSSLLFWSSSI